ncbi:MAG: Uncharacterised protein [Opitutia bacterium UBA7350]|nr:MAG: Uncharacterised protein [Opitutae bacterium UBA7350]
MPETPKPTEELQVEVSPTPLISVESAIEQVGEAVLADLKAHFNGKPTEMRSIDNKDRIFKDEMQSH